jgi:hypothetical protein
MKDAFLRGIRLQEIADDNVVTYGGPTMESFRKADCVKRTLMAMRHYSVSHFHKLPAVKACLDAQRPDRKVAYVSKHVTGNIHTTIIRYA